MSNSISECQYGFLNGKCTLQQLLSLFVLIMNLAITKHRLMLLSHNEVNSVLELMKRFQKYFRPNQVYFKEAKNMGVILFLTYINDLPSIIVALHFFRC